MTPEISNKEAIEMMNRCKHEIQSLRGVIERLRPKADAYDNLVIVLGLLPKASIGMGEDLVWTLEKRIRELAPKPQNPASNAQMQHHEFMGGDATDNDDVP